MTANREHPGHKADVQRRIDEAREHYETRRERRPRQLWRDPYIAALIPPHVGHVVGAVPEKVAR